MADAAQYQIVGSSAHEIAASAEAAIREGRLHSGEPLPTVRALAGALGCSPATVGSAYRMLRHRGLILAAGRRGTRVAPRPAVRARGVGPRRALAVAPRRDLTLGLPDPALLPSIPAALARIDFDAKLAFGHLDAADDDLLALAAASFARDGVRAGAVTVQSGALDAIERVLMSQLRAGDRVVVEDPAYPPFRDILLALGLEAVPVRVDEHGLVPEALDEALSKGARAVLSIPRAQNPFGAAIDSERAAVLRSVLAGHADVLVIEDDHAGAVSGAPYVSLIGAGTARWAVVRSMSKLLHPDIRVALVTGDETTLARVEGRQALGPRWVSHVLQALVAELLRDPEFESRTATAAGTYAARRGALLAALAEQGIHAHGRSGLNVWVPVREEARVVAALLDAGWLVLAGELFRFAAPPAVRVTIAALHEPEAAEIAEVIASVEHAGRGPRAY